MLGAPNRPFIAWNAVTFKAAEPPRVEHNIASVLESFKSFGIAFSAYAFVNNYFKSLSAGFTALRKNKWFLLGIALIVIYAVLAFVFQRWESSSWHLVGAS